MFGSQFKRSVAAAVLGTLLSVSGTDYLVPTAQGQQRVERLLVSSPQAQQLLQFILTQCGMAPALQHLVVNAVRHHGPQRADIYLTQGPIVQVMAASPAYLCGQFRIMAGILADLPTDYYQAYVDGYFQVAPALERFTAQVIQFYVHQGNINSYLFERGQTIRECMGLLNTIAMDPIPNKRIYVALPPACR